MEGKKMKGLRIVLLAISFVALTNTTYAASLYNSDSVAYACKIRAGTGLNEMQVYPDSTEYFDCTYGCEITLVKTGQTIKLESDADLVIDDGELKRR